MKGLFQRLSTFESFWKAMIVVVEVVGYTIIQYSYLAFQNCWQLHMAIKFANRSGEKVFLDQIQENLLSIKTFLVFCMSFFCYQVPTECA